VDGRIEQHRQIELNKRFVYKWNLYIIYKRIGHLPSGLDAKALEL
jgi:hypothetical protein